jgi:hypothetical protein
MGDMADWTNDNGELEALGDAGSRRRTCAVWCGAWTASPRVEKGDRWDLAELIEVKDGSAYVCRRDADGARMGNPLWVPPAHWRTMQEAQWLR